MEDEDIWSLYDERPKLINEKAKHYEILPGLESIDVIKRVLTKEEYIGALKFNILKYQLRLGKKDSIEKDQEKIQDYLRELEAIVATGYKDV